MIRVPQRQQCVLGDFVGFFFKGEERLRRQVLKAKREKCSNIRETVPTIYSNIRDTISNL